MKLVLYTPIKEFDPKKKVEVVVGEIVLGTQPYTVERMMRTLNTIRQTKSKNRIRLDTGEKSEHTKSRK